MHSMDSLLPSLAILGASDFWVTKWLTPLWLLGTGVGLGLILLGLLVLLLKGLSFIPIFGYFQNNRFAAHICALVATAILGIGFYVLGCPLFDDIVATAGKDYQYFNLEEALQPNKEQVMYGLAVILLSSVAAWGLVFGAMPKNANELSRTLTDGITSYYLVWCGSWVLVALGSSFLIDDPISTLRSIPQLFTTGRTSFSFTIDVAKTDASGGKMLQLVDVPFNPNQIAGLQIKSDKDVLIADTEDLAKSDMSPRQIDAGKDISWVRGLTEIAPISMEPGAAVYILNLEDQPAVVDFLLVSIPPVPETMMVVISAITVFFFGIAFIAQTAVAPKLSAVALATAKSELAQPLFLVLMFIGLVAILTFVFLPFYTFGEDTKSLKECGITVILVLAIFQGVWAASGSVSDEIEGRTALTVLSKPIQRRSFVIGKFLGIFWVLLLMFIILGSAQLFAVSYKPLFEARETSETTPLWQGCFLEVSRTIPGLVMALMQATVLSAISVAVSTRLPQLANFAVCFGIYLVGNLTPTLVGSSEQQFEIVRFVAQLIAVVIPMLDHYSMQAAIDANNAIPFSLLCGNLVYTGLYVALSMFIALLFFEDRDLA